MILIVYCDDNSYILVKHNDKYTSLDGWNNSYWLCKFNPCRWQLTNDWLYFSLSDRLFAVTPRRNGFATPSTSIASFEDLHRPQGNHEAWARDTDIARPTVALAGLAGSGATPSPSCANVKSTTTVFLQWLYLARVVRLFNTSTWADLQIKSPILYFSSKIMVKCLFRLTLVKLIDNDQ